MKSILFYIGALFTFLFLVIAAFLFSVRFSDGPYTRNDYTPEVCGRFLSTREEPA